MTDIPARKARPADWLEGARPRTLPAAVAPVIVGTGAAIADGKEVWWRAAVALVVALAMQVGVNYANDYSDGVRGTDANRVGPFRLTGSGAARPAAVKAAAFASFAVGMVAGLALVIASGHWWLIAVGAACVVAAWFYTGGEHPYGYRGLGEPSVFVFFGLVATTGTYFVQAESISWLSLVAAIPVGSIAVALLEINNLRDRPRDEASGKRTIAVRIGDRATRRLYIVLLEIPFLTVLAITYWYPTTWIAFGAAWPAIMAIRPVRRGEQGAALIPSLRDTGFTQVAFGVLFALGLVLSR